MKNSLLCLIILINILACKQYNTTDEKVVEKIKFPTLYQSQDLLSSLHINSDSSYKLSHKTDIIVYNEIGDIKFDSLGNLILFRGIDISDKIKVHKDTIDSEILAINLEITADNQYINPFKIIIFDSIIYSLENNRIVIEKKQLYNRLMSPLLSWEDFNENFLYNIIIKSGNYYMIFYEAGIANEINLTIPSYDQLLNYGQPVPFMKLAFAKSKLIVQNNSHPDIKFTELQIIK